MSKHFRSLFAALCGATALMIAGCGEDSGSGSGATGTTCPTGGTTLTYQNFGQSFMDTNCTRCHAGFSTVAGVRASSASIDAQAGSGPNATNTAMPTSNPKPTVAERKQLSEWLACGAP